MAKTSGEVRSSSSSSSRGKTIKQREGFITYNTKDGIIEVPELHIDIHGKPVGTIEWKLWEKNDKKRLYGYCPTRTSRPVLLDE